MRKGADEGGEERRDGLEKEAGDRVEWAVAVAVDLLMITPTRNDYLTAFPRRRRFLLLSAVQPAAVTPSSTDRRLRCRLVHRSEAVSIALRNGIKELRIT